MAPKITSSILTDPVVLRRFDAPDESRVFAKGRYDVIQLRGVALGRASYQPGWRWSEHVGAALGQRYCAVEHLGFVLSGAATAALADGRVFELRAGMMFYIPPQPHDSWVIGDEPYVSLHMIGVDHYAK